MITSIQNNQVKKWRKLHKRKERHKTGTFLVEGFHLIEEAQKSNWDIVDVIVQEDTNVPDWCADQRVTVVSTQVFQQIAQTETPQGIIAVIARKQLRDFTGNQILLIDRVQDPGNLGTMIRTADAAGFSAVVIGERTVDPYNDKVLRATQGSIFHLPVYQANLLEKLAVLKEAGFSIWAAALEGAKLYHEVDVAEKVALIVGNEGAGIDPELLQKADTIVKIPIYGKAESLNVSIAAAILMYHMKKS